ncbi:zinc finger protein 423-like [Saccoglossus kowalevskii]
MSRRKQAKPRALKRENEFVIFDKCNDIDNGTQCESVQSDSVTETVSDIVTASNHDNQLDAGSGDENRMAMMKVESDEDSDSDEINDEEMMMMNGEEEEGEIYKCDCCRATFTSLSKFMDHRNMQCNEDGEAMYKLNEDGTEAYLVGQHNMDFSYSQQYTMSPGALNPYACQFCDKAFSRLTYLKKHEQVHSDQMPWKCNFCSRLFKHKRSRDRHVKLHTGDKKYQCPHCQAAFARSDHLKIHVKTHNSNKPFQCNVCNRGYTTAGGLTAHSFSHHRNASTCKEKEFKCLQCTLSFNSSQDLQMHVLTHSQNANKETVMQCSYCAELFNGKNALLVHVEKAHCHDKRNKCPICTECFQTVDFLYEHMNTHSQRPEYKAKYRCPYCPKHDFPSVAVLSIHIETIHTDKPTQLHTCEYCGEELPSIMNLNDHIKSLHDKKHCCQYCTLQLDGEAELQMHISNVHAISNMDKWYCQQCTMGFASETSLQEHLENVHNASHNAMFSCEHCMKVYTSQEMLEEHREKTHRKPLETMKYPCPYCIEQNLFNSIEELQIHVELQHRKEGNIVIATPDGESASIHSNSEMMENDVHPGSVAKEKNCTIQCPECQQNFQDLEQLQSHLKTHMGNSATGPNTCTYCNLEFAREEEMQKHVVTHFVAVNVEYSCQNCVKSFPKPDELQKHLFDIHAHHLYKCSLCKEVFDSKVSVQVHFAIKHSNESKLFKCTKCGVVFRKESDLHLHIRMDHLHHSTRMYRCLFCHMAFQSEVEFQCHLTTHKKQFQCDKCDAAFPTQQMLSIHDNSKHSKPSKYESTDTKVIKIKQEPGTEKDHVGEVNPGDSVERIQSNEQIVVQVSKRSNFSCDICGSTFAVKILLENHQILEHSNQMQNSFNSQNKMQKDSPISGTLFMCPMCMKTFTSSIDLQSHLGAHLLEMEQHKLLIAKRTTSICSVCKEMIVSETDFLSHAQRHNNEKSSTSSTIDCVVCLQSLTSMAALQLHARYHTQAHDSIKMYQCYNCHHNFDSTVNLTVVLDSSGKPTYCCQECQGKMQDVVEQPIFRCPRCKIKCETQVDLDSHMSTHVQEKTYQCIKCQKTFTTEKDIQIHVTTHMIEEGMHHECKLCQHVYDSPAKLQCHLIDHTYPDKNYRCHICNALFSCALDIQTHAIGHGMDSRDFKCDRCTQVFFFEAELENHIMVAHKLAVSSISEQGLGASVTSLSVSANSTASLSVSSASVSPTTSNEYQCIECSRTFSSHTNLQNHMKIHLTKDKTYKCSLCPEVFSTTVDMQQHYFRTHSESELGQRKKTYKCAQCDKVFPCMSNLQGHMRIHTLGKKYPCSICHKVFALARNLTIHMRSHSGEKPYQCPLCDKRFARKENRKVHLKAHSGLKPFMCPHCGKMFSRKCHVKDHMRTHSHLTLHPCSMCDDVFSQIKDLQRHINSEHNNEDEPIENDENGILKNKSKTP